MREPVEPASIMRAYCTSGSSGLYGRVQYTVFDGSGAVVPPVAAERRVLVAGAHQDAEYIAGYLGAYRLLISDLLLLTMAEEPMADEGKVAGIRDHFFVFRRRLSATTTACFFPPFLPPRWNVF